VHGRAVGARHSCAGTPHRRNSRPVIGYGYIHSAVDDHSRLAYSEILPDEQAVTAAAFWQWAQAFFTGHAITVQRVLTDNGSCYRSTWRTWRRYGASSLNRPFRVRNDRATVPMVPRESFGDALASASPGVLGWRPI
jgi:hypothetical protein